MTAQEIAAFALGAAAVVYLALRWWRRRSAGTCCGEAECPAAKEIVERMDRS